MNLNECYKCGSKVTLLKPDYFLSYAPTYDVREVNCLQCMFYIGLYDICTNSLIHLKTELNENLTIRSGRNFDGEYYSISFDYVVKTTQILIISKDKDLIRVNLNYLFKHNYVTLIQDAKLLITKISKTLIFS